MFYLRTGGNGSCKTLFTLRDVRDLQLSTGRPVAHNGRFKIYPHIEQEFGWKKVDFKLWWDEPDGTIFIIDEAYHDLPVRPNGQQPPAYIAKLAEHRARGFDFFFLCLHPSQIDNFVRKAIGSPGWHQHLKRVAGASNLTRVLQWDSVHDNCQKDGSGKTAQIQNRIQPKEVYAWYDSAFIHTGKVKIPKQVWMFIGFLALAIVLFYLAGHFLYKNVTKNVPADSPAVPVGLQTASATGQAYGGQQNALGRSMTDAEYVAQYKPRIDGLFFSAPRYDELTRPTRVPVPVGCVLYQGDGRGSFCITQQGTRFTPPLDFIRSFIEKGFFLDFDPDGGGRDGQQTPSGAAQSSAHAGGAVSSPVALK